MDKIRSQMNNVETFADYIHNFALELISYFDALGCVESPQHPVSALTASQAIAQESRQTGIQIQQN